MSLAHGEQLPVEPGLALQTFKISSGHYGFGQLGNIALQVWLRPADEVSARELAEVADRMHESYPDGISTIHWLRHGTGRPSPEARKHISGILKKYGDWMGEAVVVMEGDGFWASAIRGMLTGIRMAAGRGRIRVHGSIEDAAAWLPQVHQRRTGIAIAGSQVAAAINELLSQSR